MTVFENVAFGLLVAKNASHRDCARVTDALRMVQLEEEFAQRKPHQLSGGQQQRGYRPRGGE